MSRTWYLLALVPLALGIAIAAVTFMGMVDDIKAMQRVVVPGEGTLSLDAGEYVAYGESTSTVYGVSYSNSSFSVRCALLAADGSQVPLEAPTGNVSYTMGGFQGRSMFELTAPAKGTYTLRCEGDGAPAVIAVGRGVGTGIVVALLSGLGGLIAGIVVFVMVRRRRKRAAAAATATATAPTI